MKSQKLLKVVIAVGMCVRREYRVAVLAVHKFSVQNVTQSMLKSLDRMPSRLDVQYVGSFVAVVIVRRHAIELSTATENVLLKLQFTKHKTLDFHSLLRIQLQM